MTREQVRDRLSEVIPEIGKAYAREDWDTYHALECEAMNLEDTAYHLGVTDSKPNNTEDTE